MTAACALHNTMVHSYCEYGLCDVARLAYSPMLSATVVVMHAMAGTDGLVAQQTSCTAHRQVCWHPD